MSYSVAATDDAIWVGGNLGVARVDRATTQTTAFSPGISTLVAAGPAGVFMASYGEDEVRRLDPATAEVMVSIPVTAPVALAVDDSSVWVFSWRSGALERFDAASGERLGSVVVDDGSLPFGPSDLLEAEYKRPSLVVVQRDSYALVRGVWIATGSRVVRVDPETYAILRQLDLPGRSWKLAFTSGSLWVASGDYPRSVLRVDPATDTVTDQIDIPGLGEPRFGGMAPDSGALWVATMQSLARIDTNWNEVTDVLATDFTPGGIVADADGLWTPAFFGPAIPHGDQLLKIDRLGSAVAHPVPAPVEALARATIAVVWDVPIAGCAQGEGCYALLDIHRPVEAPAQAPAAVVLIHGSGVDRSVLTPLADVLASRGAVVYNADSLGASCAVLYARATALEYGADPQRIVAVGHSAGYDQVLPLGRGPVSSRGCADGVSTDLSPVDSVVLVAGAIPQPSAFEGNPALRIRLVYPVISIPTTDRIGDSLRDAGLDAGVAYVEGASHTDVILDFSTYMPTAEMILEMAGIAN